MIFFFRLCLIKTISCVCQIGCYLDKNREANQQSLQVVYRCYRCVFGKQSVWIINDTDEATSNTDKPIIGVGTQFKY